MPNILRRCKDSQNLILQNKNSVLMSVIVFCPALKKVFWRDCQCATCNLTFFYWNIHIYIYIYIYIHTHTHTYIHISKTITKWDLRCKRESILTITRKQSTYNCLTQIHNRQTKFLVGCFDSHINWMCLRHKHETRQNLWICIHIIPLVFTNSTTQMSKQDWILYTSTFLGFIRRNKPLVALFSAKPSDRVV